MRDNSFCLNTQPNLLNVNNCTLIYGYFCDEGFTQRVRMLVSYLQYSYCSYYSYLVILSVCTNVMSVNSWLAIFY